MRASCANSAWRRTPRPSRSNCCPAYKQLPECVEDGATFEENAIKKARHYGPHAAGLLFADDSGLEVDALGGAPGVYSARFSGPDATDESNNRLLLEKLRGVDNRRGALRLRHRAGGGRRACSASTAARWKA